MIWTPEDQRKVLEQTSKPMVAMAHMQAMNSLTPEQVRDWLASVHPLGCIGHCDPRLIDDKDERESNP
jgi:hypothetical protein